MASASHPQRRRIGVRSAPRWPGFAMKQLHGLDSWAFFASGISRILRGFTTTRRPVSAIWKSWTRSPQGMRRVSVFSQSSRSTPLRPPAPEAGSPLLDEDYLILSTIHSAKGQEWDAVFILNVADGCI